MYACKISLRPASCTMFMKCINTLITYSPTSSLVLHVNNANS